MQTIQALSQISTVISEYAETNVPKKISVQEKMYQFFLNYMHEQKSLTYLNCPLTKKISRIGLSTPSSPYTILHDLFKNIPVIFIKSVLKNVFRDEREFFFDSNERRLTTDCFYTALACSVVFNGLSKTREIPKIFFQKKCWEISYSTSKGREILLTINNIFSGFVLTEAQKDPAFENFSLNKKIDTIALLQERWGEVIYKKYYSPKILPALNLQLKSKITTDEAISLALENGLKSVDYSVNLEVLNSLKNVINTNSQKTSHSRSFAYLIAIIFSTTKNPLLDEVEHIFFVEQFFRKGGVSYRLYESLINFDTFLEAQRYFRIFDINFLNIILENLKESYCTKAWENLRDIECTGYRFCGAPPHLIFNRKTNCLDGHWLVYNSYEFNPNRVHSNLLELGLSDLPESENRK